MSTAERKRTELFEYLKDSGKRLHPKEKSFFRFWSKPQCELCLDHIRDNTYFTFAAVWGAGASFDVYDADVCYECGKQVKFKLDVISS